MNYTGAILITAVLLGGCAHPLVKYDLAKEGTKDFRFQLAESMIKFDLPKNENGGYGQGADKDQKFTITSVPIPFEEKTYTITGTDETENWGVKTDIQATHRQDTLLLQEVGSQITDSRKQIISDVASAVATGAALFAASNPNETLSTTGLSAPTGLSVTELLKDKQCPQPSQPAQGGDQGTAGKSDSNEPDPAKQGCKFDARMLIGGGYTDQGKVTPFAADITIGPLTDNAELRPAEPLKKSDALFYSACRTLNIQVTNPKLSGFASDASLRVADPRWIEWVRIPAKGKVVLGATCGADVTSEDAGLPTAMDYVNTSISAAKSIKDTLAGQSGATDTTGAGH